ncbi:MAG: helix-turn-helix domain-containing protein [Lachnospiraceae bacterium]|nr:helix-turn-helix domain-containing protein [Lachnospiraceae bacterium]
MTFGEKVKEIRKRKGLSQLELGEKMNISQQAVAKYERINDPPKLTTVRKIADALDITISELIDDWGKYTLEEISSDIDKETVYKNSHRLIEKLESIEDENGELNQELLEKELQSIIKITKEAAALSNVFEDSQLLKYSKEITELLKMLNDAGRNEALKRVEELTQLTQYKNLMYSLKYNVDIFKEKENISEDYQEHSPILNAAHERTDISYTDEDRQADEDMLD